MSDISIRPIDYKRDKTALKSFLAERDQMRLEHCEKAIQAGDAFIFVADDGGKAVGWAQGHLNYRDDQDWEPDPNAQKFQSGENAYLENIEVTAGLRGKGVGAKLLEAAQGEAKRHGKKLLWLHTSENNEKAHKVFERAGWQLDSTVYPPWKPSARTRIYKKTL
jgi:GNAT superfamily N-acetyltransferase